MANSRTTPDRIAMCQHPEGTHEHVPLKPGENVGPCFADCDCTPAIYVALDAVLKLLRESVDSNTTPKDWRKAVEDAADRIEREFGDRQ